MLVCGTPTCPRSLVCLLMLFTRHHSFHCAPLLQPQVAQVFGYQLSLIVDGEEQEELQEGEDTLQPLPLSQLRLGLSSAGVRLSGGRLRPVAAAAAGGGSGRGGLSPAVRVSAWLAWQHGG
jgi:hypothetical protein